MARGKHASAAARRRQLAANDRLAKLAADLLTTAKGADAAASQAAAVHEATERLRRQEANRDAAVADELSRLENVLDKLEEAVEQEESLRDRIKAAWGSTTEVLLSTYGGGVRAWEHFLVDINADNHRTTLTHGVHELTPV